MTAMKLDVSVSSFFVVEALLRAVGTGCMRTHDTSDGMSSDSYHN